MPTRSPTRCEDPAGAGDTIKGLELTKQNIPTGVLLGPDDAPRFTQQEQIKGASAAKPPRPLTESATKAQGALETMSVVARSLDDQISDGTMPKADEITSVIASLAAGTGKVAASAFINTFSTPQARAYVTQALQFALPNLRLDTGAVIGADELSQAFATQINLPGDDPETMRLKQIYRMAKLRSTMAQAYGGVGTPEYEQAADRLRQRGINIDLFEDAPETPEQRTRRLMGGP